MIMWYAWSPAAQLGQSLNLMHKENHALQSYALQEVLLYLYLSCFATSVGKEVVR